jgi:hypothetical protein
MDDGLFFDPDHFLDDWYFLDNFNELFDCCWNLFDLFYFFFDQYNLFDNSLAGNRNFEGNNHSPFDLNYLLDLDSVGNDFVNTKFFGHFDHPLNNFFSEAFNFLDNLSLLDYWDNFFLDDFNNFLLRDIDIDQLLDFDYFLDSDRHFDFLDDLNNLLYFDDSFDNFFYYLRYLYDFFNDSRDNNYLLYYLFDLDYFGDLDHFFDDFVDADPDFLDLFYYSGNFDYLFDDDLHWHFFSDILDNMLGNFHNLGHLDRSFNVPFDFNDLGLLTELRYYLFNDFCHSYNLFLNDWHFDPSLHFFYNFLAERDNLFHNDFNFFDSVLEDDLFFTNSDFLDGGNFSYDFNDFLNDFGNFLDLFDSLVHWHNLFNDSLDDLRNFFYMVDCLFGWPVLDCVDNFFNDFFNFNDDRFLHYSLNNLLYNSFNFFNPLFNFLDDHGFLPTDLYLLNLRYRLVHYFLNNDWLLHFDDLFPDNFYLTDLRNFDSSLHYFFNVLGNLY